MRDLGWKRWLLIGAGGFILLLLLCAWVWRDDILRTSLDPQEPFQVYAPPPAPDYALESAWALLPSGRQMMTEGARPVDVFFVHPTTYNGGRHWNGPIDDPDSARQLRQQMIPNYAGPFDRVGRVYAPRYRQAGLYAYLTRRDDAVEARRFAYGDVERAFRIYLDRYSRGRPFIIVGVEQGGFLADRLLRDVVAPDPALRSRLVAAYLLRTVVPAGRYGPDAPIPACAARRQAGCVVAFVSAPGSGGEVARGLLGRALVWGEGEWLVDLKGDALCVNPLLGAASEAPAGPKMNLGGVNATKMEWGARPAPLPHQVSAQCQGGVLRVSRPKSRSLRAAGGWADRLKAPGFNPFFADIEADAMVRASLRLRLSQFPMPARPISQTIDVKPARTRRID